MLTEEMEQTYEAGKRLRTEMVVASIEGDDDRQRDLYRAASPDEQMVALIAAVRWLADYVTEEHGGDKVAATDWVRCRLLDPEL